MADDDKHVGAVSSSDHRQGSPRQSWSIHHEDSVQTAASLGVRIEVAGTEFERQGTAGMCLSSDLSDNVARAQGFGLSMQPCDGENATRWYLREHEAPADSYGTFLGTKAKGTGCLHFSGAHEVTTTDSSPCRKGPRAQMQQKIMESRLHLFSKANTSLCDKIIQSSGCGRDLRQRSMGYTADRFHLAEAAVPQAFTGHRCEAIYRRILIAEIVMGMLLPMPLGCMHDRGQKPPHSTHPTSLKAQGASALQRPDPGPCFDVLTAASVPRTPISSRKSNACSS